MAVQYDRYDFAAGSRDVFSIRCVDDILNAVTGKKEETAIDLTGKTVEMYYSIAGGTQVGPKEFVKRLPQTGDDLGYADYEWDDGELTEGQLEGQIIITGSDSKPHKTPDYFYLQIGPSKT